MPDEVSCPDPDEAVTRKILDEVLEQKLEEKLEEKFQKYAVLLSRQLAEENRTNLAQLAEENRTNLAQQARVLEENILRGINVLFEEHGFKQRLEDHESRITRLEARPAKQVRKPATRKPRKPK